MRLSSARICLVIFEATTNVECDYSPGDCTAVVGGYRLCRVGERLSAVGPVGEWL